MTQEVTLLHVDPTSTMEIVRELRNQGLVQGIDFDFAYHQAKYDNFSYEAVTPRHSVFTFYEDKWSTWFILKYKN